MSKNSDRLDISKFLSNVFLFDSLSKSEIEYFSKAVRTRRLKKGELLFSQGATADAFFIVAHGQISIYKLSKRGDEQVLHVHSDREVLAEAAIFGLGKYPASAKAISPALVVIVPRDSFVSNIIKHPEMALKIMASYSKRLHEFVNMIEYLSLDDIKLRLMKYILKNCVAEKNYYVFTFTMPKKELAALLGTVPETFSRALKILKNDYLVKEDKDRLLINDLARFKDQI